MKILNVAIQEGREGEGQRVAVTVEYNGIQRTMNVTDKYELLHRIELLKKYEVSKYQKMVISDLLGMVGTEI